MPKVPLKVYNIQDVQLTDKLFHAQEKILKEDGLLAVAMVKSILAIVLTVIESRGLLVDEDLVLKLARETNLRLIYCERKLAGIADLNVKSSKQKVEVIFGKLGFKPPINPVTNEPYKTPAGELSTDSTVLLSLEPKTKEQKEFLSYLQEIIKLRDLKSKYLDKLEDMVRNGDKLHFTFSQISADTHRLSSKGYKYGIQGQNIPRNIKNLFTTEEGYILGEADHSTVEYTCAGFLGRDGAALLDLKNGVDAHGLTAGIIFEGDYKSEESPKSPSNSPYRQAAKAHTFKPLYGGQFGTDAEIRYYKWFREKHSGITKEQEAWAESACTLGYVRSPTGLKFYFPEARRMRNGNVKGFTKIANYCIQYLATGEISPIAVIFQHHMMKVLGMESQIINTVHDQSLTKVKIEEEELYKELAEFCFVDCVLRALDTFYSIVFDYPLKVEVETGTHWKMS